MDPSLADLGALDAAKQPANSALSESWPSVRVTSKEPRVLPSRKGRMHATQTSDELNPKLGEYRTKLMHEIHSP
jgi:hypothetical protein